jgi:hypothetical protein
MQQGRINRAQTLRTQAQAWPLLALPLINVCILAPYLSSVPQFPTSPTVN